MRVFIYSITGHPLDRCSRLSHSSTYREERPVSDDSDSVKQMARRAGIELTDERAQGLTGAIRNLERVARALAASEYGEAEPAARFKAPRPDK